MAKRKWNDLSVRTRKTIIACAAIDGTLKAVALADLVRRPSSQVRGSKAAWAVAVTFVNSLGVIPVMYLARGRQPGTTSVI